MFPFLCHAIQARRLVDRVAKWADIAIPHIINEDENDIRRLVFLGDPDCEIRQKNNYESKRESVFFILR